MNTSSEAENLPGREKGPRVPTSFLGRSGGRPMLSSQQVLHGRYAEGPAHFRVRPTQTQRSWEFGLGWVPLTSRWVLRPVGISRFYPRRNAPTIASGNSGSLRRIHLCESGEPLYTCCAGVLVEVPDPMELHKGRLIRLLQTIGLQFGKISSGNKAPTCVPG